MGLSDGTKGFVFGFTVGFGAGAVFRDALPHIQRAITPLVKLTLKSVILMAEKSREMSAHAIETVQDLVAEVTDDLRASRQEVGKKKKKRIQPPLKKKHASRTKEQLPSVAQDAAGNTPEKSKIVSLQERRVPS